MSEKEVITVTTSALNLVNLCRGNPIEPYPNKDADDNH